MKRAPGHALWIGAAARVVAGAVITGVCGALAACGAPERAAGEVAGGGLVVLDSRIDAVPGRTLVVPVRAGSDVRGRVPVVLDDGRELEGKLWRVVVEVAPGGSSWLPPAGVWRAEALDRGQGAGERDLGADGGGGAAGSAAPAGAALASTMVTVDLPLNVSARWATIGGARVRLNVLGSLRAPGTVAGPEEAALVERGPGIDSPVLQRLIAPERDSPMRRWRYRLLTGGAAGAPRVFDDPVIEAIALQEEGRWSWALRALLRTDRDLARRLTARLVATTDFGAGVAAPTWPVSQGDLAALQSDLLDPSMDGARRAERGAAFLLAQPVGAAWIADDAGTPDAASTRPMVDVGVANLSDRPVLAAAAGPGVQVSAAEPRDLAPWTAERFFVVAPEDAATGSTVSAMVGGWRRSMPALMARLPGAPPGVSMGPLLADHTLESWMSGAVTGPMDPGRGCVAMLLKKDRSWTLFVECARPLGEVGATQEDTVRVWIGPTARPRLVMRVGESGYAHVEQELGPRGDRGAAGAEAGATVASRAGKWVCEVTIPAWCIEADGTLRIGLERVDGRGARSAFPRAMLAWQEEPGRVMVDTGAWGR